MLFWSDPGGLPNMMWQALFDIFYKTVMFKLRFAFMLNLIELEHKQTTPKTP